MRFQGTIEDVLETNLWLRTADRVKIVVGEFYARSFEELFEPTKALPWDEFLPLDANFPVAGKSQNLPYTMFLACRQLSKRRLLPS